MLYRSERRETEAIKILLEKDKLDNPSIEDQRLHSAEWEYLGELAGLAPEGRMDALLESVNSLFDALKTGIVNAANPFVGRLSLPNAAIQIAITQAPFLDSSARELIANRSLSEPIDPRVTFKGFHFEAEKTILYDGLGLTFDKYETTELPNAKELLLGYLKEAHMLYSAPVSTDRNDAIKMVLE